MTATAMPPTTGEWAIFVQRFFPRIKERFRDFQEDQKRHHPCLLSGSIDTLESSGVHCCHNCEIRQQNTTAFLQRCIDELSEDSDDDSWGDSWSTSHDNERNDDDDVIAVEVEEEEEQVNPQQERQPSGTPPPPYESILSIYDVDWDCLEIVQPSRSPSPSQQQPLGKNNNQKREDGEVREATIADASEPEVDAHIRQLFLVALQSEFGERA